MQNVFSWVTFSAECKYLPEFTDEGLERKLAPMRSSHAVETAEWSPELKIFGLGKCSTGMTQLGHP